MVVPLLFLSVSCEPKTPQPAQPPKAMAVSVAVDGKNTALGEVEDVSVTPAIRVEFSREVSLDADWGEVVFSGGKLTASYGSDNTIVVFTPAEPIEYFKKYSFSLPAGTHFGVRLVEDASASFYTCYDPNPKFPEMDAEELVTMTQRQAFMYFWDHAHPMSGMARERLGSGDTVTSGGSGFGIMTIPMAIERGFITREEGAARMRMIINFLANKAQRYHGAWSHWINGTTGAVMPFSGNDNGADLVETAFLIQGLLTAAGYFTEDREADIRVGIDELWRGVEWDWFTRGGQNVLYWHWSPSVDWAMNMQINGWNEALIIYVLAASSPTHPIQKAVYDNGWARQGKIRNNREYYGVRLPLGEDYGGPLFFAHYSFLGLDPRGLKDQYADYWEQNVAHATINWKYCTDNPKGHAGYKGFCWGLTASDIPNGYSASSPTNDLGVIAPTAALASFPYTPEQSMAALRTFYYTYGDRLWGEYGPHDAFSLDAHWFATSYIAIDQGPIAIMIENWRTGLLWDCFMSHPDILLGLQKLGFTREEE